MPPATHKIPLIMLASAAAILFAVGLWLASGYELTIPVQYVLRALRGAGPGAFFLAMALLPALGVPLSLFCLTVGSAFGPQLGMATVVTLSMAAIAVNVALSYMLARQALRHPLESVLKRLGYQLPQVQSGNIVDLVVLLRVTPGLPFPAQNYLLGIAGVPFFRYLLVSCLVAFPLNAAIIVFGDALVQGEGGAALAGLLVILAAVAAIRLARRRFADRGVGKG